MNILKKLYNWSSSWTGTIVIVLGIIFFIAQAFVIPSGSMKNSMLIGDMLFVKKNGDIYTILYKSQDIPNDAFFSNSNLEKKIFEKVKKALLSYKILVEEEEINSYIEKNKDIYDNITEKSTLLELIQ